MEQAMAQRADSFDSIDVSALSPQRDSNPPTSSTTPASIDRRALMRRAHLIARRFIGILPNYRACIAYGLRCGWADAKARHEHRERFKHIVPRALPPEERRASERATRRCGASYMPF
jgi:hypothetical protein